MAPETLDLGRSGASPSLAATAQAPTTPSDLTQATTSPGHASPPPSPSTLSPDAVSFFPSSTSGGRGGRGKQLRWRDDMSPPSDASHEASPLHSSSRTSYRDALPRTAPVSTATVGRSTTASGHSPTLALAATGNGAAAGSSSSMGFLFDLRLVEVRA
jgi:hypothetical protein